MISGTYSILTVNPSLRALHIHIDKMKQFCLQYDLFIRVEADEL